MGVPLTAMQAVPRTDKQAHSLNFPAHVYARIRPLAMIGFIRKVHDNGAFMAYRYNGFLLLETDGYQPKEIARLYSPEIQDWNQDGLI